MPSAYTNVAKPTGANYTRTSKSIDYPQYGTAIYGVSKYGIQNNYTGVSKPTGSTYTNVNKPTT
jgi:hypothetical protein